MAVTTSDDVEAALMRSLTDDEVGFVYRVVEMVEADVLGRLPGYDLAPAASETVTVTGTYDDVLTLPAYPVSAVSAVSVNAVSVTNIGWSWSPKGFLSRVSGAAWPAINGPDLEGYWVGPLTSGRDVRASWGGPTSQVTVTYVHGQPSTGSGLILLIADAVAQHIRGAPVGALRSMTLGDYSESYAARVAPGLIDQARLRPYLRTQVGSVRLLGA